MAATGINCLAVVLKELGWSYTRLIAELRRHAGVALPKTKSMVTLVSRWANNHQQPDDFYRDLLSRATGRARAELFGDEPVALAALPSGLVVARSSAGLPTTEEVPLSSAGLGSAWTASVAERQAGVLRMPVDGPAEPVYEQARRAAHLRSDLDR